MGKLKLVLDAENGEPRRGGGTTGGSRRAAAGSAETVAEARMDSASSQGMNSSSRRVALLELNSVAWLMATRPPTAPGWTNESEARLGLLRGSWDCTVRRFCVAERLRRTGDCSVRRGPIV